MDQESLNVDLTNLDSMRDALPRAREILESKEAELAERERDVHWWRGVVAQLADRVGDPQSAPRVVTATPVGGGEVVDLRPMDLVVEVVNREARPIRSRDVRRILEREGHALSADAVSNALYYASERQPQLAYRVKRGWYAPLNYQAPEQETPLAASITEERP